MLRGAGVIAVCVLLVSGATAAAGERVALRAGDRLPELDLVDIEGEQIGPRDYRDWVQVVTFADRDSSEELKSWMGDAQLRATRAHPDVRVVYMSFADLAAVPRLLRRLVRPMLRRSFEKSNEELAESYRKVGIEPDPAKVAFRFIPDWDGTYLEAFGLEDAVSYHGWIVAEDRVVAVFDATTPNPADHYVEIFERLDPGSGRREAEP